MPIVIPTAEEVDRMSHAQRATWRKRLGLVSEQVQLTRAALLGMELAQVEARVIADRLGPDPDAAAHRAAILT